MAEEQRELPKDRAIHISREKAIANVLATESGKELFGFLFEICGFEQTSVVMDTRSGKLDLEKTLYNEARRAVYLQLRALAPADLLKEVEFRKIQKTEEKK